MKILVLAFIALICLQPAALAVPDSIVTGPYKVSFDLGVPHKNYNISVLEPKSTELLSGENCTVYNIQIQYAVGITRVMLIAIVYYDSVQTTPTQEEEEYIVRNILVNQEAGSNIKTAMRTIDNSSGAVGLAAGHRWTTSYVAQYRPKFDSSHVKVIFFSFIPWDEGTLQLLKTIHIEKINATA